MMHLYHEDLFLCGISSRSTLCVKVHVCQNEKGKCFDNNPANTYLFYNHDKVMLPRL